MSDKNDLYTKLGYGKSSDVDKAIEDGVLDGRDLVITKDTEELLFIDDDKKKHTIRTKPMIFESEEEALSFINNSENSEKIYLGQQVVIKVNDEYVTYTIQQGDNAYIVKSMVTGGLIWQTF